LASLSNGTGDWPAEEAPTITTVLQHPASPGIVAELSLFAHRGAFQNPISINHSAANAARRGLRRRKGAVPGAAEVSVMLFSTIFQH
jgi:hypothetical protein